MNQEVKTVSEIEKAISERLYIRDTRINLKRFKILDEEYQNLIFLTIEGLNRTLLENISNNFLKKYFFKNIICTDKEVIKRQLKIINKINQKQEEIKGYSFLPTGLGHYETKEDLFDQILRQVTIEEKKYIYAYLKITDKDNLELISEEIETMTNELKNTLLIIVGLDEFEVPLIIWKQKEIKYSWQIRYPNENEYSKLAHLDKDLARYYYRKRKDIFNGNVSYNRTDFYQLCNPYQLRNLLLFEENEDILGFIDYEILEIDGMKTLETRRIMRINKVYVKEQARRKKIASRLYEEVWKKSIKEKCDSLEVQVYDFTLEAKLFFKSLGLNILSYQYEIKVDKK